MNLQSGGEATSPGAPSTPRKRVLDEMIMADPVHTLQPRRPPVVISRGASALAAVELMNQHGVGCVLVVEAEQLVGIVTERDILRRLGREAGALSSLRVEDIMTPQPKTLQLSDPIVFALNVMSVGGFRHVPLVDDRGRPVGVLSVRHMVHFMADFFAHQVLTLPPDPKGHFPLTPEGA